MKALVTGAASGIGGAAVRYFAERGYEVYAVDVREAKTHDGAVSFTADVTDYESLAAISRLLGERGVTLDVIVSVAGIHAMSSLVEEKFEGLKRVIDVNLLGAMATVRAFHPRLSERGRVVIVTSEVATYDPMPFNGLYNVSKTALDSYAQALRQELNLLGQTVVTVRPGAVATPLAASSATATEHLAAGTELYKRQAKHFSRLVAKFTGKPMPPERVAALIYKASTVSRPRLDYSVNRHPGLVALSLLPRRLQCAVIRWLLNRS